MSIINKKTIAFATYALILIVGAYTAITINIHSLPHYMATAINISLGLYVYSKNRKRRLNRIFSSLCFVMAILNFDIFGLYIAPSKIFAAYWVRIFRIGMILMPPVFVHFTLAFIESNHKIKRRILYSSYIIAFVFIILNLIGNFEIEFHKLEWKYSPEYSLIYKFFLINLILFPSYAIYELFQGYRKTRPGIKREQFKYLFFGTAAGISFALTNVFLSFGIKFYPLGGMGYVAYTSIVAYAIVKHQLLDIQVVIKRSLVYASLTAAIAGTYFIIISIFTFLFRGFASSNVLATIVFALLVVFGFQPLRDKVQYIIDKLFFKDKYDYQKTLRTASRDLTSIIDLDQISALVVNTVAQTMYIDKSSLLLWDNKIKGFRVNLAKGLGQENIDNITLRPDNPFIKTLSGNSRQFLNKDKFVIKLSEDSQLTDNERKELEEILKVMDRFGAVLSIPLISKDKLVGVFNLGAKKSEDAFTEEDIALLFTIANQAAVALENYRLYMERREIEKVLHQRDKMAALGTLASSIAHEIKNPLTPIKTFIQLLPRKFDDLKFRDKFNAVVPQEIERLDHVLQELTDFSKPSKGKWAPISITKAVDEMLLLMRAELAKHGIMVKKEYEENVPNAAADREQVKQVFMNLIINAVHAMPGGGTLTVKISANKKIQPVEDIIISFADTGCGIPADNIPNLFDTFFSTKENGTGLGLTISHKIIRDHNGAIKVKSKEGKGTTFTINLPLSQDTFIKQPTDSDNQK